jgi:hypothetical protein
MSDEPKTIVCPKCRKKTLYVIECGADGCPISGCPGCMLFNMSYPQNYYCSEMCKGLANAKETG